MAKPGRRVRFDLNSLDSAVSLTTANELDSLLSPPPSRRWNPSAIRSPLTEVEDRRTFHPLFDQRPVRSLRKWSVRMAPKAPRGQKAVKLPSGRLFDARREVFGFDAPEHVMVCVRRSRRKEVLHALKKTGKGGGRRRPPKRNAYSDVRC